MTRSLVLLATVCLQTSSQAPLTCLYWPHGEDTAPALKEAAIDRLCVPPDRVESWRLRAFEATPLSPDELSSREALPVPGITRRADLASATRSPWVVANGWRFMRKSVPSGVPGRYKYDLPAGKAAIAAAEAFAYGADAVLTIDPTDLPELGRMFAFLAQVPASPLPALADFAVVDDGTDLVGEVMNLFARRNLLFQPVPSPSPRFRINVALGAKEYPREDAANPSTFALKIRRQLTDEQRTLRVYGSEVVICRLTGEPGRVRLHLLNYGGREIAGLRIRLRGVYRNGELYVPGVARVALEDYAVSEGATEFSIPRMTTYAVVDLASP
jgi:hypothetical protein